MRRVARVEQVGKPTITVVIVKEPNSTPAKFVASTDTKIGVGDTITDAVRNLNKGESK